MAAYRVDALAVAALVDDEHVPDLEDGEDDQLEEGNGREGREERLQHGAEQQVGDAQKRVQDCLEGQGKVRRRRGQGIGRGALVIKLLSRSAKNDNRPSL